jgi:lysophospholipid hydrolase
MVQVFAQTSQATEHRQGSWDEEDMNGYQLLNEVGSGGTLSSLFTILSLFTEDVKISWQDDEPLEESYNAPNGLDGLSPLATSRPRTDSDVSQLDIDTPKNHFRRSSGSSSTSTIHPSEPLTGAPPLERSSRIHPSSNRSYTSRLTQLHHGIVARATEDTTLAVIPAEAFRRLTKNFPKATGHIVQGVLILLIFLQRRWLRIRL